MNILMKLLGKLELPITNFEYIKSVDELIDRIASKINEKFR